MYSGGARLVEGKPSNRNTSSSTFWVSTQRPKRKASNYSDDRWINGKKPAQKGGKHPKLNTSPPRKDQNSSPARKQSWMENECDEMMESDFRRWIMRDFCELKEHVLNQCKDTKNLEKRFEKRFEEMITRMDNLERNMNELKELKNTTREFCEACTSFNSQIDQAEERIPEVEDQLNEIK